MDESLFYNGTRLINIKRDKYGNRPEIFAVDGNRSAGKTTWFGRWFVRRFKKYNEKFMLIYRYGDELDTASDKFFEDIRKLFFPDDIMKGVKRDKGAFVELFLNDISCGYAVALNFVDKYKKNSHLFSDVKRMLFDEFQAKKYIPGEADLLFSLHVSVARGEGQAVRYCPVYMCANHLSSLNPYYKAWGCAMQVDEIAEGFYLGDGFVIEKNMNSAVAEEQKLSGFNRAFKNTRMYKHSIENESLTDSKGYVEELKNPEFDYLCTISVDGNKIALRRIKNNKKVLFYFDNKIDPSFKVRYAVTSFEHMEGTQLLGRSAMLVMNVRKCYEAGYVRFSSLEVKDNAFQFMMILL